MQREKACSPVRTLCRALGVSPSGFSAWCQRPPSAHALTDAQLVGTIQRIHQQSDGVSGVPRVHAELRAAHQVHGARKRVARLMRTVGLRGVCRGQRKWPRTTRREPGAVIAADLVRRQFTAEQPDQLWVADITYLPTYQGFLYLAVVLDAFSRKVVGWSMAPPLRTGLVLGA